MHFLHFGDVLFYRIERFIAYDVLHFAGILGGGLGAYAEQLKVAGEHGVPLVYLLCDLDAGVGEAPVPQLVGNEIAAAFEQPARAADARL